jgi:hypothetical protein
MEGGTHLVVVEEGLGDVLPLLKTVDELVVGAVFGPVDEASLSVLIPTRIFAPLLP